MVAYAINEGKPCPLDPSASYDSWWLAHGQCQYGECVAYDRPVWPPQPYNPRSLFAVNPDKYFVNLVVAYADLQANAINTETWPYVAVYVNSLDTDPICVSPFLRDSKSPEWTFKCYWDDGQVWYTDKLMFALLDAKKYPSTASVLGTGSISVEDALTGIKYEPPVALSPNNATLSISYEMVSVYPPPAPFY